MTDTNEAHLKRYVLIKKYIYTDREGKFEDNPYAQDFARRQGFHVSCNKVTESKRPLHTCHKLLRFYINESATQQNIFAVTAE